MSLLDQSGGTGGELDPYNVCMLVCKHGQHVDGKIWKLRLSCLLSEDSTVQVPGKP